MANRLDGGSWQIVELFVEIESGKRASRSQLDAALTACKKHKATLVVAKLDRLSRNVGLIHKLLGSGVEVLFADLPDLNGAMGKFMLITRGLSWRRGCLGANQGRTCRCKEAGGETRTSWCRSACACTVRRLGNARSGFGPSSPSCRTRFVAGRDRRGAEQAEGSDPSWRALGSLLSTERDEASCGLTSPADASRLANGLGLRVDQSHLPLVVEYPPN